MNERIALIVGLLVADLGASFALFRVRPSGALCGRYPNAVTYAGQHMLTSMVIWMVVFVLMWFAASKDLFRRRHRETAKIRVLMQCMIVGIAVDAFASLYQLWSDADLRAAQSIPYVGLGARLAVWTVCYLGVVGISVAMSGSRNRSGFVLRSDEDDLED